VLHTTRFLSNLKQRLGVLDRFYIPTRYPNGLPGGIPAEVYLFGDAQQAISLAGEAIELVAKQLGSTGE